MPKTYRFVIRDRKDGKVFDHGAIRATSRTARYGLQQIRCAVTADNFLPSYLRSLKEYNQFDLGHISSDTQTDHAGVKGRRLITRRPTNYITNRQALLDYWSGRIATRDFLNRVKRSAIARDLHSAMRQQARKQDANRTD